MVPIFLIAAPSFPIIMGFCDFFSTKIDAYMTTFDFFS